MSRRQAKTKGDDPKKKDKQQAASLARRMAGKKGQTTQLQIEVNNEEDWEKLLAKEGLIVIDVYSEWSGPCVGMIGNLKKAKVDLGGDLLHLAIAKNDEIEVLSRFRNRSEPTWMFAAGGQLITVTFGANAPKLIKMIETEVKQEQRVLRGETWRRGTAFTELTEEEKDRLEVQERLKSEADRLKAEKIEREIHERRVRMYQEMSQHLCYETVVICFPHTIHPDVGCVMTTELDLFWRTQMVYVATQFKTVITKDMFNEMFFQGSLVPTQDLMEDLALGPCLVLLLKSQIIVGPGQEGEKFPGEIEKQICESVNMVKLEEGQEFVVPNPASLPAKYPYIRRLKTDEPGGEEEDALEDEGLEEVTSVPGCWTPASAITKCACVKYLFPARAEKVMAPEEPPTKPKIVIAFDVSKQKECFDLIEEYEDEVLNYGYFTGTDPTTAEQLCATPEQYAKLPPNDSNKLVLVVKKLKSEPLLSFAGLGAAYVSADDTTGSEEADLFFPPGVVRRFHKLEEIEAEQEMDEPEEGFLEEEEEEQQSEEEDENDLMALLGVTLE